ncbi:MAG: 3'-5' exonuclease, partial [Nitrososphaera sp.]
VMSKPSARAPNKPELVARNNIPGDYPPVCYVSAHTYENLGAIFAKFIRALKEQGTINDYSECVLLLKSTRRSTWNAEPFMDSLDHQHIKCYNPRSKSYLEAEEIQAAMGAFLEIIDRSNKVPSRIKEICDQWRATFHRIAKQYPKLQKYVDDYLDALKVAGKKKRITTTMQDILYYILNHEPFLSWAEDPQRTYRLGQLTKIFESYSNVPILVNGRYEVFRGTLRTSGSEAGAISFDQRQSLYYSLISLLIDQNLDDPEDEEMISPTGYLPIMTVHQAKGLEFQFVFVADRFGAPRPRIEHVLEEKMLQFRSRIIHLSKPEERAEQDLIRLFYVAYSRAIRALVIMVPDSELDNRKYYPAIGGD